MGLIVFTQEPFQLRDDLSILILDTSSNWNEASQTRRFWKNMALFHVQKWDNLSTMSVECILLVVKKEILAPKMGSLHVETPDFTDWWSIENWKLLWQHRIVILLSPYTHVMSRWAFGNFCCDLLSKLQNIDNSEGIYFYVSRKISK